MPSVDYEEKLNILCLTTKIQSHLISHFVSQLGIVKGLRLITEMDRNYKQQIKNNEPKTLKGKLDEIK